MNVAALELDSTRMTAAAADEGVREPIGHPSEWIDPEGDDWLASIYRFLTEDPALPADGVGGPSMSSLELERWFG
jgi:hypothetical protein